MSTASGHVIFTAAAKRQARKAAELDSWDRAQSLDEAQFIALAGDVLDASLSSVLSACFAMEATINELFLAQKLGLVGSIEGLDPRLAQVLGDAWESGAEGLGMLEKAGMVSIVCGKGKLDLGSAPMQSGSLVIALRNELVHHKPKWVLQGQEPAASPDKLERSLSPLFARAAIWKGRGAPFRWNDCLGGGCATWAASTADAVNRAVYAMAGATLPPVEV